MHNFNDLAADQLDCIDFILDGEDSIVCADVGTGKTVIALTAAAIKLDRGEVKRWLVLAPLLVATETWANEPGEWSHLLKLKVAIACGDEVQRIAAIESDADIVVLNYENLVWLMDRYPKKGRRRCPLPFDGLICDELDKLKDVSSKRFKEFRNRIGVFRSRIGLTGTLVPNKMEDVWGQTYLIDEGESFGRSFYRWRRQYFYPTDYCQRKWAPFPATRQEIISQLAPLTYRLREPPTLPPLQVLDPHMMDLPPAIRIRYKELEKDLFLIIADKKGRLREVEAANAAVLTGKLQQICAGFSYVDRSKDAVWHSQERFDWYDELYSRCDDQLLVFYHFQEELAELRRRYPGLHYLGGGVSRSKAREAIRLWNEGSIRQLALHPASAGHGLNLQKSSAHNIVFLTLPWSGGLWRQAIGRLRRRGQTAPQIRVHTALYRDTIDESVFDTVVGRSDFLTDFLDDLEAAGKGY